MRPRSRRVLALLCSCVALTLVWLLVRPTADPAPPLATTDSPPPSSQAPVAPAGHTAMEAFDGWLAQYRQAPQPLKGAMEAEGARLAAARRPAFRELIRTDPRLAIASAVPMVIRQSLPPSILNLLEERVAARAELRLYGSSPESVENGQPNFLRYAETKAGKTYEAHVYGRREQILEQLPDVSINGVAIDNDLAVSESPLRRLEVGEIPNPLKQQIDVCPVSGITSTIDDSSTGPIAEATTAVEVYDEIIYLCDGAHIVPYEQSLIMGESSSGGAQSFTGAMPAAAVPSVGVVKVLYVPAVFADQGQVPASEATCHDLLRQVADFYLTQSYGKLTLVATVTPPVRLPRNQAWYKGKDTTDGYIKEVDGLNAEMVHAKEAARALGYDWQDYHCFIVRANGGARAPTSFGSIGAGQVWMRNDNVSTVAHEVGHAFGLTHANFWVTNGASVIGPGGNEEYGDIYDNMGTSAAVPPAAHYNVQSKNQVKWLPDEYVPPIQSSGLYRIYAFDTPRLEPGKRYGVRLTKDAERTFWGEHRTLFPTNPWVSNGLLLGWKWPTQASNAGSNLQLLDTTPGSINAKNDAPIALGSTFSDHEAGIHITTLAINTDTFPPSTDVQIHLGDFPGNRPPDLTLTPASAVVPQNSPVTFSATAIDPDGDSLAYSWRWHDAVVSPNHSTVTRSFSTSGIYTASCVVSDQKGGIAVRNAVITVGSGGSRFTISGRITREGAGLRAISVTTSGSNGTLTDSDGYYTISNLIAGTYSVTPAEHGYQFNEAFNNSVTVGPSFSQANFVADPLPTVTLTAPTPVASEGPSPESALFRLTRTGSPGLPLAVNTLLVRGTAVKNTDYSFSPDYAAITNTPYFSFTIPADEEFLDIVVTPLHDVAQEGDETVQLILGMDSAYLNGVPATATVTIQDDDTALPRVSLSASNSQAQEGAGDSITCTMRRTGSTVGALVVPYTFAPTNTAANSADFATLSGSVSIPTGAAAATFQVIPIDDSQAEPTETLTISISSGASFIADTSAATTALRIVDNDTQWVSLITLDATATEVDRHAPAAIPDPGTFLVRRSGDSSEALTIYYGVAGSALHGTDYEALQGFVKMAAGQTETPITIMPRMDALGEAPETVTLSLAAGNESYQLEASSSGTITIADATGKPVLEVMASSAIAQEPGTNGTFRITAKGSGTGTLNVNYTLTGTATAGSDYASLTGTTTLTLNNGTVTRDLTVTVLDDLTAEELETVVLTLTPSDDYTLWEQTHSATLLLRDNDQPTVFADPQVGTGNLNFVSEGATTTCKFWISRTGSTTGPLTVNYSLVGSATNGVDHSSLSGVAVIPATAPGVDVTFNPVQDSLFEGTETVTLRLESGAYARGPDATVYIQDNDAGAQSVSFATTGSSGSESQTTVEIPVKLSSPATAPVSVEYSLETGARTTAFLTGRWVRVVRTGNSFETFSSENGTAWTKVGTTRTIAMGTGSYLAGLAFTSTSVSATSQFQVDNVSVSSLSPGGSVGAKTAIDIGSALSGGHTETDGVYHVLASGADISAVATDTFHFIHFPISNSANCTITARILNFIGNTTNVKAGVMFRESTSNDSRHFAMMTALVGGATQHYRTTAGANAVVSSSLVSNSPLPLPRWLRLSRTGNSFQAFSSSDGTTFTPQGVPQNLGLSSQVLVGLGMSSRIDGQVARATLDQVVITPAPDRPLTSQTIGFVSEPGSYSEDAGVHTLTASGNGFLSSTTSTEDEGHFAYVPVTGDFTMTARLTSFPFGGSPAQAGLMVRESTNHRARTAFLFASGSPMATSEFRGRFSSTTSGEGAGVDYSLASGTLNFGVGDQSKNIVLNVNDDLIPEPLEFVTLALKFPNAAVLGSPSTHTYAILDDDSTAAALPAIGFGSSTSTVSESAGSAVIPIVVSQSSSSPITVNYATTGSGTASSSDYTSVSGTITFDPGETLQTITVPILADTSPETSETVIISLSNPTASSLTTSSSHTLSIADDDVPVVTITANDPIANEGGGTGQFTFARTGSTTSSLTVNFARSGTAVPALDFTAFSSDTSVTFPPGQPTVSLTVTAIQNTAPEIAETVIITLASGSGYAVGTTNAATVTIEDDDVNTVTLTASDPVASESGGNPGEFTLSRTGPTTASLNVGITITGTATAGSDFLTITTPKTIPVGQSSVTFPLTVLADSATEGTEVAVVSISASSSYIVGSPSVASVAIIDDDLPPSVFVSSPSSKSTIMDASNGLVLEATADDDGLPAPLTYAWTKLFGPGTVAFGSTSQAATTAAFSAAGVYGLRITVDDGQFSATDDIIVQAGGFEFANWIGIDQGPPGVRGISGESSGAFTLIGSGSGYTGNADSGHMLFRQLLGGSGNCTIIARLSSLAGPATRLAGITIRDTSWKSAKRVNLVLDGSGVLQFRRRLTSITSDTSSITSGLTAPRWLKLERSGGMVTASHAADVGGAPGTWTEVGSAAVTMGNNVVVGMVVSAGASGSATATAQFDHVAVTPTFDGVAVHSEDLGNYSIAGSASDSSGTVTINAVGSHDSTGGHFNYRQIWGDCIVTARLVSHSGAVRGAQTGIAVRDTTDNGPFGFYGTTTTDGFQAHWRSSAGGSIAALQTGGAIGNWIRLVRKGNNVSAFRAANVGGQPGTWAQVSSSLPAPMNGPLLVGLLVDSNSTSVSATGSLASLTVVPMNTAPAVDTWVFSDLPPFTVHANAFDDGRPTPPGTVSLQWSALSGPGLATFATPAALSSNFTLSTSGTYVLRLVADDGEARTFSDLSFNGYLTRFAKWQDQEFTNGLTNTDAAPNADPDLDGHSNFLEYALATEPELSGPSPVIRDVVTVGSDRFLRLSVPKNPGAPELIYVVEATSDLRNPASWSGAGLVVELNNSTTLRVRDHMPMTSALRRFMRVRVHHP